MPGPEKPSHDIMSNLLGIFGVRRPEEEPPKMPAVEALVFARAGKNSSEVPPSQPRPQEQLRSEAGVRFALPFVADPQIDPHDAQQDALAYEDSLTELPNRRALEQRLEEAIASARRSSAMVGIVFLDVDGFKDVNDSFGHDVGDRVLLEFAGRIRAARRSGEIVGRFGGDEFAAIYPVIWSHEELSNAAARISELFNEPVIVDGTRFTLSASVGIAVYPRDGSTGKELLDHADAAMYRAKSEGRSEIRWYSDELGEEIRQRRRLLDELNAAEVQRQLFLVYQPITDVATHEIVAAEALLRWLHPTKGLMAASEIIAEAGNIPESVDYWTISQAIAHAKEWTQRFGPLKVNVNISSPSQDLIDRTLEFLASADVPPQQVAFELPEDALGKENAGAAAFTRQARERGIDVILDRFTGNSTLSELRELSLSAIKLSPAIVREIGANKSAEAVVSAGINIARTFGWSVIANGVETAAQQSWLYSSGLRLMQGYAKGLPATYGDFTQWLALGVAR